MLAVSAITVGRLHYPLLASPKLDGMRLCITEHGPVTRNLHRLPNEKIAAYLDRPELRFLDGELVFGDPVADDVVRQSITAGMRKKGPAPNRGLSFWVFDSFENPDAPFTERYATAQRAVAEARLDGVVMVPQFVVGSDSELMDMEVSTLVHGFEGVVLRRPDGPYVFGRVSPRSRILMKLKRRSQLVGKVVAILRRPGQVNALLVKHQDWPDPFEVPVYGKAKVSPSAVGQRVRFSRHPGSWKGAPRAPLFIAFENKSNAMDKKIVKKRKGDRGDLKCKK